MDGRELPDRRLGQPATAPTPTTPTTSAHHRHRAPRRAAVGHDHGAAVRPGDERRRRLLSLPRDLWVDDRRQHGKSNRINAAFSKGPDVLIKTVAETPRHPDPPLRRGRLPGLQAPRRRHRRRVRSGSTLPARDTNTGLRVTEPGCVKLDGLEALQYARSRHFETGDQRHAGARTAVGRPRPHQPPAGLHPQGRSRRPCRSGVSNPLVLNELIGAAVDNRPARRPRSTCWPSPTGCRRSGPPTSPATRCRPTGKFVQGQRRADHERQARPADPRLLPAARRPCRRPASTAPPSATADGAALTARPRRRSGGDHLAAAAHLGRRPARSRAPTSSAADERAGWPLAVGPA